MDSFEVIVMTITTEMMMKMLQKKYDDHFSVQTVYETMW